MKKIVPFALLNGLMLWFANISTAQDNAYLQNNPVWRVQSTCSFFSNCVEYDNFNYFLNGDTILDGMVYQKIFRRGYVQYSWFGPPPAGCSGYEEYEFEDPSFLIRSHEKRIYMWMGQSEEVLYDFDLEVGSVLPVTWNNYAEGITVSAIDSIYTPYGYRKTFALTGDTWSDLLIEGIGHNRGLFEPISIGLECGHELFCFSLNDTAYYPEPGEGCMLTVGVNEPTASISDVIYPNPFRDFATIQLKDGRQFTGLNLYNSMGQRVLVQSTSQNDRITLERGSLPAGLYFYELLGSNAVLETGKLIVVD